MGCRQSLISRLRTMMRHLELHAGIFQREQCYLQTRSNSKVMEKRVWKIRLPMHIVQSLLSMSIHTFRLLFIGSIHEKEIGLGRAWKYPPLGENDVILSTSLTDAMKAHIGDSILLRINISHYLATIPDETVFQ